MGLMDLDVAITISHSIFDAEFLRFDAGSGILGYLRNLAPVADDCVDVPVVFGGVDQMTAATLSARLIVLLGSDYSYLAASMCLFLRLYAYSLPLL